MKQKKQTIVPPEKKQIPITPKVIGQKAKAMDKALERRRQAVFGRFPLLFTLLGTFGVVATFYGFEGVIDKTGLSENPWVLLAIGLGVLVFTGTLYKKLEK